MRKIPTLFVRSEENRALVTEAVTPGCEWVLAGEGEATAKWDGTACLVKDGGLWKRYDAKAGKVPPPSFISAQDEPDPVTGHWPGWVPVTVGAEDKWHHSAWARAGGNLPDGTYELVGPKLQGNPHGFTDHRLIPHGKEVLANGPSTFEQIRTSVFWCPYEGVVWHHPDGRMCKIKRRDFGFPWPVKKDADQ